MFVLDTLGGDHAISLGETKMNITFQRDETMTNQGVRTTITSFTITDVDGLIYKFTQKGYTKILKVSFSDPTGLHAEVQPTIKDNNIYYQAPFDLGPTAAPWNTGRLQYIRSPTPLLSQAGICLKLMIPFQVVKSLLIMVYR